MKQTLESPPARTLRQAGRAVALLASLGLAACVSVPMAPLVYGSKTVGGLDIATNTGANPGVSISIGYKRDDLALVPVAVLERKGQADETLKIVTGRDGDGTKPDDGKPVGTPRRSSDAMSVFGSFEGRGMAGSATATTSAQAVAANYPRNGGWTRLLVRLGGCLARSDNAAGSCLQGGATKPGARPGVPAGV